MSIMAEKEESHDKLDVLAKPSDDAPYDDKSSDLSEDEKKKKEKEKKGSPKDYFVRSR